MNFIPKDHRQHYHSETCREDYYNRVFFGKTTVRKVCPNCGEKFPTTKPGRQIYCKPECREEAKKKRQDGLAASMNAERKTYLGDRFAVMEKDSFRCVYCGRGVRDGLKLSVEDNEDGKLHTVCNQCAEGREFNKPARG